ncbi:MAG TPA: tetratricopeptide repeat protein [Candidatus Bathyarchaeia archaeon]|nr:tetratricopeptide repeat protein [Candidatus Bathyarchaeia archaeon]
MKKNLIFLCALAYTHCQEPTISTIQTYQQNNLYHDALILCNAALATTDQPIPFYLLQGTCFLALGDINNALAVYNTILSSNPQIIAAQYNKGYAYKIAGNFAKAIPIFKKLITQKSDYEHARLALSFSYLSSGDFARGWHAHTWYLKKYNKDCQALRSLIGTNRLSGKKIALISEGGLGDTIQFIRYAQRLKECGAIVTAHVQEPLIPLLSRCPFIDTLVSAKKPVDPHHDATASLMSLPAVFHDNEKTFPCTIPYIFPDQALVQEWKKTFTDSDTFNIGICWQASIANDESRLPIARRGMPLALFAPLASLDDICLYSIQKYDGAQQGNTISFSLTTFPSDFDQTHGSFMDTAAIMMHLDLIITVDTAIAHLAGALGKPVWLLLPFYADWRWIYGRTDSPWYPTMRIFQQKKPFDWESVIKLVCEELKKAVNNYN